MEKLTFKPMRLECVVVMRGDKVAGTIRRRKAFKTWIARVPGILTAEMAIGKGLAAFPTLAEAKARLLELDSAILAKHGVA